MKIYKKDFGAAIWITIFVNTVASVAAVTFDSFGAYVAVVVGSIVGSVIYYSTRR